MRGALINLKRIIIEEALELFFRKKNTRISRKLIAIMFTRKTKKIKKILKINAMFAIISNYFRVKTV